MKLPFARHALLLQFALQPAFAHAEVLHVFSGTDGANPTGGVVSDPAGVLYGTTSQLGLSNGYGAGTVYSLTPPAAGSDFWTFQVLLSFVNGGYAPGGDNPDGDLLRLPDGSLVGATEYGGSRGDGVIFELSPPATAGAPWTETVLYQFNGDDGYNPQGGLIADASGALYGAALQGGGAGGNGGGKVYRLTPPAQPGALWNLQTLHEFGVVAGDGDLPNGNLAMDASGSLYGSTRGGGAARDGVVFRLTPTSGTGAWSETILHDFAGGNDGELPDAGVTLGRGTLFGTTAYGGSGTACGSNGCGTVFELSLSSSAQAGGYSVIYTFHGDDGSGPDARVVAGRGGALYGTAAHGGSNARSCTYGCGAVFKLSPPAGGQGDWNYTYYSPPDANQGYDSLAGLLIGADGFLYGTAYDGGAMGGTVFRIRQ